MILRVVALTAVLLGVLLPLPALSAGLIGVGPLPDASGGSCCGPANASRLGPPQIFAGYLEYRKVVFSTRTERTDFVQVADDAYTFPVQGLWLGGAQKIRLSEEYDLVINGSYLIPANRHATEDLFLPGLFAKETRDLKTSIQWWTAGVALVAKKFGLVNPVAGFTYDSFSTGFEAVDSVSGAMAARESDLAVTGLVPYVGLLMEQAQWAGGAFNFGVAAFPAYPAHVEWRSSSGAAERAWTDGMLYRGYFLQVAADYAVDFRQGRAGIFASWSLVHTWGIPSNRAENPVSSPGTTMSNTFHTTFDRQAWIIGASYSFAVSSPF